MRSPAAGGGGRLSGADRLGTGQPSGRRAELHDPRGNLWRRPAQIGRQQTGRRPFPLPDGAPATECRLRAEGPAGACHHPKQGPNDFATAAKSHDALRAGYEGHGHKVHAILAYNQNSDQVYSSTYYDGVAQLYKTMQTVWYHYDVPRLPLGASLLFMNVGLQAGKNDSTAWDYDDNRARTVHQQMFGAYVRFHPQWLTLEASYYRQSGKTVGPAPSSSAPPPTTIWPPPPTSTSSTVRWATASS